MLDRPSLLLDIGNTSIKYAWYQFPNPINDLHVLRTSIDSLSTLLAQASSCWLCSVVDDETNAQVAGLCENLDVPFHHARTQAIQFGITNAYMTPANMGTDRWMAIIAGGAMHDYGANSHYIVLDAGTAITCDFVVGAKHLGGWIAPGLSMARGAVVKQTKRVFDQPQTLFQLEIGTNTPQCVSHGALAQLCGMLSQACKIMYTHCSTFQIYVSGGDAPLLINAFTQLENKNNGPSINYIENLVLVGLAKIAHENIATNV